MADLICTIDSDDSQSKINHVSKLVYLGEWDNVYLIAYSGKGLSIPKSKLLTFDMKHLPDITEDIRKDLKEKIKDFEVGVNFISGDGKLHMAVLGALLKLGLGLRLIAMSVDGVKEI